MLQNQHKNRTNSKPVSKPLFGTERKILLLVITSIFSTALFTVFVFHHYLSSDLSYRILSRSDAIFSLLLSRIPPQSVTDINTSDDSHEILYKRVQTLLDGVRKTTAVRYLYTAKRNAEGRAIYVVDGLPPDSEDFRQAGNLIEDEVAPVANICLDGKSFLGTKVMDTSWGKIIPACEPIKLNGITVGALIIEFDVNSFAESARRSSLLCLAFSIGFAMAAATVTTWLLRWHGMRLFKKNRWLQNDNFIAVFIKVPQALILGLPHDLVERNAVHAKQVGHLPIRKIPPGPQGSRTGNQT